MIAHTCFGVTACASVCVDARCWCRLGKPEVTSSLLATVGRAVFEAAGPPGLGEASLYLCVSEDMQTFADGALSLLRMLYDSQIVYVHVARLQRQLSDSTSLLCAHAVSTCFEIMYFGF